MYTVFLDVKIKTEKISPTPESQENKGAEPIDEPSTESGKDTDAEGKKKDDREAGELSGEEEQLNDNENQENQEKDDDEDSDDDNVQVTIGDIKQWTDQPRNLFKGPGGYQKATTGKQQKGVDLDAIGTTEDGVPIYEFDLDSIQTEDKPWRKPGADITDYFNYGFNEETWKLYCEKQKALTFQNLGLTGPKGYIPHSTITPNKTSNEKKDISSSSPQSGITGLTAQQQRKAHPPPNRKMGGTIDVIGSTARDSRRPNQPQSDVQVQHIPIADSDNRGPNFGGPVVLTSTVPTVPPHMVPPPDFAVPPPTVHGVPAGIPPPGMPILPPGFPPPEAYDAYYHPPPTTGPPQDGRSNYDSRSGYSYGGGPQYGAPIYSSASGPPNWNARSGDYRERWEYGGMSQMGSDSEFSSSGSELDYRYRDRRRYDRDREYSRYRDRDRESYKDRSRSAERDKDRRHKDDKHRSRRKHKDDEDSDAHKSKHKKSKRSKRDRDDEVVSVAGDESVKGE